MDQEQTDRIIITSGIGGLLLSLYMFRQHKRPIPTIYTPHYSFPVREQDTIQINHIHHPVLFRQETLNACGLQTIKSFSDHKFLFHDNNKTALDDFPALQPIQNLLRAIIRQAKTNNIPAHKQELWCIFKLAEQLRQSPQEIQHLIRDLNKMSMTEFLNGITQDEEIKRALTMNALLWHNTSPNQSGSAVHLLRNRYKDENALTIQGDCSALLQELIEILQQQLGEHFKIIPLHDLNISTDTPEQYRLNIMGQDIECKELLCDLPPQLLLDRLNMNANPQINPTTRIKIEKSSDRASVIRLEGRFYDNATQSQKQHLLYCPSLSYLEQAYQDFQEHGFSKNPVLSIVVAEKYFSVEAQFFENDDITDDKRSLIKDAVLQLFLQISQIDPTSIENVKLYLPKERDFYFGGSHMLSFDHLMPVGHLMQSPFLLDRPIESIMPNIKIIGFGGDANMPSIPDLPFILVQK